MLHIEKQHGMYQVVNQKKLAHKTKDIKKNLKSIIFLISNILAFSYWNKPSSWQLSQIYSILLTLTLTLTFHIGGCYHIETSPLICRVSQWTGFYMIATSFMKELIYIFIKERSFMLYTHVSCLLSISTFL